MNKKKNKHILWFSEIGKRDVGLVGGKNASLGEMYSHLSSRGVKIPNGFTITALAYRYYLKQAGLNQEIKKIIKDLNINNLKDLQNAGLKIRKLIASAEMPHDLTSDIMAAYGRLSHNRQDTDVAVRSSATAEDLPGASFAGQQETFLNVRGDQALLKSIKKAFASLYTDRAISYRLDKGFANRPIALSVCVQHMVRSDMASSGVMFTIDTETGFDKAIIISAAYGLGENVVQGKVIPDQYAVFKPNLSNKSWRPIIDKRCGSKEYRLVYSGSRTRPLLNKLVSKRERLKFALKDQEIIKLAQYGKIIEDYYQCPMDIEWAKDGRDNNLYIVQARPETIHAGKIKNEIITYRLQKRSSVIVDGQSIGEQIAVGKAKNIKNTSGIGQFKKGEVLVTKMTDPDWEPIMKIASAIITDSGGRTSHAAIVARELGIPAIVGTKNGSRHITTGQVVTVSCAEGAKGYVYRGRVPFKITKVKLKSIPKTKTKVMLILGEPYTAFSNSFLPVKGIGLARLEFIISNSVKIHPLALINYFDLKNKIIKGKIAQLTGQYQNKKQYYVDRLSFGIARLAAAFYPNDVIVRFSDFKSNEYANLIGGKQFEPQEENPMLGWRGASRYYHHKFSPAFQLECEAIKKVRETMGLSNVKVMIPFCRTLEEAKLVINAMNHFGLPRKVKGLEIYMMVEIPSNVILLKEFAKWFDGFSIGSNDLTQLTLGLDRDSALVANVGDERNEAVKKLIADAITKANSAGVPIGICGQAPTDFPEITELLVRLGIDSISVSPDKAVETLLNVSRAEKKKKR